jgi:hypothetical protein
MERFMSGEFLSKKQALATIAANRPAVGAGQDWMLIITPRGPVEPQVIEGPVANAPVGHLRLWLFNESPSSLPEMIKALSAFRHSGCDPEVLDSVAVAIADPASESSRVMSLREFLRLSTEVQTARGLAELDAGFDRAYEAATQAAVEPGVPVVDCEGAHPKGIVQKVVAWAKRILRITQ